MTAIAWKPRPPQETENANALVWEIVNAITVPPGLGEPGIGAVAISLINTLAWHLEEGALRQGWNPGYEPLIRRGYAEAPRECPGCYGPGEIAALPGITNRVIALLARRFDTLAWLSGQTRRWPAGPGGGVWDDATWVAEGTRTVDAALGGLDAHVHDVAFGALATALMAMPDGRPLLDEGWSGQDVADYNALIRRACAASEHGGLAAAEQVIALLWREDHAEYFESYAGW